MHNNKKNIYRVLYFLSNIKEASGQDIEKGLRLPQPEVSVAVKELEKEGWIESRRENYPGKGRPIHIYKLKYPIQNIKSMIKMRIEDEAQKQILSIFQYLNGVN